MKLTVVHLEGSKQGQTEYLPGPVVAVGRDPASNQLAFDPYKDLDVSSNHASITFQGDQVMLQDLGSRNGTFLNGARVNGAVPLPNDSVVQFGEKGPKVKLSYIFHAGPGKKTQMIMDLSDKLAGTEEKQKQAEAAAKAAKSRNVLLGLCFFFLLVIGGTIALVVSKISAASRLKDEVATLKTKAPAAKADADGASAATEAKAEYDAGVAALAAAEEAEKAEEWQTARDKYAEAKDKFDEAHKRAMTAMMSKYKNDVAAAEQNRKAAEERGRQAREQEEKDRAAAKKAEEERIAKILQSLNDLANLKATLARLENSTNPEELRGAIAAIEKALAGADDAELKAKLPEFKQRLARIENIGELLTKAASESKAKVVGIRTRVTAIPAGQRPDTTKIRLPIAEVHGTGFFASANGVIVTAKEIVEPQHFDPAALALQTKLKDKGMQILTDIEVMTSTAGVYTTTYTGTKVAVARRFSESIGAEQPVKIQFDNAEVEVKVRPHRRDETNVVLLKVEGLTDQPHLQLAGDPAPGLPIVVLGTQTGGDGLEAGQVGLFLFQGKITNQGRKADVEAPSFRSWVGGPLIDADGKVAGLLISEGAEKSRSAAPSVFKAELDELAGK